VKNEGGEGFPFSYFTLLITIMLAVAAILWVIYSILPHEFYIPLGFVVLVGVGISLYFIVFRKMKI